MRKERVNGKKNIYLLGSSSLFNDVGSEMIEPILPFYITALGGSGATVGLISGLRTGIPGLVKIFSGWLSDKIGKRKIFVSIGYFFSVIFKFILAFASSWKSVIFSASFERVGKLRDPPRDAIIADSTKKRGKGFAIQQTFDRLGAVIGSLLVLFLFWKLNLNIKTLIIIAAVLSAFSLIPLIFVKEPRFKKTNKGIFEGIANLSQPLKLFIAAATIYALADFGLYMFLILRANQITNSIIIPLALYAASNLIYASLLVRFGKLSDKIGKKKVILAGYVLFIAMTASFVFVSSLSSLIVLFMLYGVVSAIIQANQRALVADLSGSAKGTSLGLFHATTGIIAIPAGLIAGLLWNISHSLMFSYLAVIAFIAVITLIVFVKEKRQ